MLITCPECESRVSSDAEVCPGCGKPDPYYGSIEYCEKKVGELKGKDLSGRTEVCRHCSTKKGKTVGFDLKGKAKPEIHKIDSGYGVFQAVSCPKCWRRYLHRLW